MSSTTNNVGVRSTITTAPVSGIPVNSAPDPEFVDFRGLEALFGIKRSLGYELLASGEIRDVSLRRRGAVRGKRLFDVASVRAYLRSQMESSTPDVSPAVEDSENV